MTCKEGGCFLPDMVVELSLQLRPEGQEQAAGEALWRRAELRGQEPSGIQRAGRALGSSLDRARPKGHVQCESWIWGLGLEPVGWAFLSLRFTHS